MRYGLLGRALSHSYSPTIHSFFGNRHYEIIEKEPESLKEFLQNPKFLGINVTIPYKESVIPYCIVSKEAQLIGCVNTIINKDGTLYGYNTDYMGFSYLAQRSNITFKNQKVLILGSGGTSKTAKTVALDQKASEVIIISRNGENTYNNISKHFNANIIINTTPIGMYPNNDNSPIDISNFSNLNGVIDVIYNPLNSLLVQNARERNINATGGLSMLVAQAFYANNLFFNTNDKKLLDFAIKKSEKLFRNIVLIGMPGCGKTTIGKELAKELALEFVDTDDLIEKQEKLSCNDIILKFGEKHFRKIESQIIKNISKKTGLVIATGGGSVILRENQIALKQNGVQIYIKRDLEHLEVENRPLSKNITSLFKERKNIYSAISDFEIENEVISNTVKQIIELI